MAVTVVPQLDIFRTPSQGLTLTKTPVTGAQTPPVLVYLNGLLMVSPDDYYLIGTTLTFTGQNVASMPRVIVQVLYWVTE